MEGVHTRITRKIRQGVIEIDFDAPAIVVHFVIEVVNMEENGRVLEVLDSKPDSRRIKINSIAPDRNLAAMAGEIIEHCKYIHPSRVEEVEQVLIQLQRALTEREKKEQAAESKSSKKDKKDKSSRKLAKEADAAERAQPAPPPDKYGPAYLEKLDDYLELLYQVSGKSDSDNDEGIKAQVEGTAMILKLCRSVVNLEVLIQNNTVMGALTRVLQEEFKKSAELTFNILRIFLAFSNFMEMHGLMANYSIGLLTMKAIDFEFKRSGHRASDREALVLDHEQQLKLAREEDPSRVLKLQEKHRGALEKLDAKTKKIHRKQEKVFFVGLYILLNLAEDINVERKMIKKGLVDLLLQSLDRTSSDLLVLAVTFLKKLSIFEENKNSFKQRGILVKLSKLLPCSSQPLMHATLRLLFNLSFDAEIRDQAVQIGMIPKLISLLKAPAFRARALRVLYHMSIEDRCKSMFTYTDGMPLIMGMIINFPQDTLPKELAGLSVNISLNARNAEVMASNRGLNHLMDRMMTTKDPLLMKIIRNISLWSFNSQQSLENADLQYKYRGLWSPHIKNICRLAVDADSHDLLVEVLGTLANLTILDLPMNQGWSKLLGDYNIMSLITKLLVPGMAQNDVLLEVIMIIAQAASDTHSCRMLAGNNIIGLLHQVWKDKGSDVEILLQLLFCFLKFFRQESCQEEAMYGTRVVVDIIDCLHHNSSAVRRIADQVCELVLELDREPTGDLGELGRKIRKKRFDSYNQKWLLEIAAEEESKLGLGSYGSYGEDELVRGHVHGGGSYDGGGYDDLDDYGHHITSGDQMYDEDIAWRAIRSANGGQLRLDADIDAIHEQMQMLGTNSSEGDTEDSWDGKQYK